MKISLSTTSSAILVAGGLISCVSAKAILGIDIGYLYMKVALVQRGAPLEIVTNLHSKRKTENMILFDQGSRFFGADANSLLARKPTKVPLAMSIMLGRDVDHPAVQVLSERHYPLLPQYNETRSGVYIMVDGKESFTPEELSAMLLNHAADFTLAYGEEKGSSLGTIKDCVLTVPSFATQTDRQARLDMAEVAGFNVLGLIDENTAAALNFGMDKMYEEPQIILFYNMGAGSLQVSVIKFHSYAMPEGKYSKKTKTVGSIEVLGKAWDATLGGAAFDNRLVDYMADHFNREWNHARKHKKDIRDIPRAMTKIRIQANKVKHVLSANQEIPIHMDSLYDDMSLSMHITREQFEELCKDLIERASVPVTEAVKAANLTMADITATELIGGGMRVPAVQAGLADFFGELELGLHINSDESMALGASFFGANISTAFRVRHVGLTDINPFPVAVSLENLGEEGEKDKKKKKKDDEDEWSKEATVFKAGGKIGVKKTIAFTHDKDVHVSLDYAEAESLPEGSQPELQRYKVTGVEEFAKEMEDKGLGKPKVSLQFELSTSGMTSLIKAEAVVEETYTVEEEVEVDDEEAEAMEEKADDATEEAAEGVERKTEETAEEEEKAEETSEEKTEEAEAGEEKIEGEEEEEEEKEEKEKPKKKTKIVEKEKKRKHTKPLSVEKYYVGKIHPMSDELIEESKAKMAELARKDQERVELEAAKNKVESYVYYIKNKLMDDEENVNRVSTEEQREELRNLAENGEEWLYDDGDDADLDTLKAKFAEISEPAEKVWTRVKEFVARPEAITEMQKKLVKVEEILEKWAETMPQVTDEEKEDVRSKVADIRKWIEEKEEAQAAKAPHEDPAFSSEEVPGQSTALERLMMRLSKKPKPKPEKKEEDENKTEASEDGDEQEDLDDAEKVGDEDGAKDREGEAKEEASEEDKMEGEEL